MGDYKLSFFEDTNFYDISIKDGDIEIDDSFNTPIIVSLFSDARANESEVVPPFLRRGFWGDETSENPNDPFGSKLWLLEQARLTQEKLNKAISYARIALSWLVTDGFADQINVTGVIIPFVTIQLSVQIIVNGNIVESKSYDLWRNTGGFSGKPIHGEPIPVPHIVYMLDADGDFILDNSLTPITLSGGS
jgi:phage gp46-like protein